MRPRSTALWLLVAVLLAGALYWSERGDGEGETLGTGAPLFPDIEAGAVRWLRLEGVGARGPTRTPGPPVRVERRDAGWRIVEPVDAPGDDVTLDGMASTLAQLTSERVLPDPEPPAVYGLGAEAPVLTFGTGEGSTIGGLRFGDPAPVGASSYIARSDRPEEIHVVSTWRIRSLQRGLDELRDRRVLPFDTGAVRRLELQWPDGGVTIVRASDGESRGFQLVAPFVAEADDGTVENLLSDLAFLRAVGFEDDPDEADHVELEQPAFEARIDLGEGRPPLRLALSEDEVAPGERLARGREGAFFRVGAEQLDLLPRKVGAYRFKQLASFESGHATAVVWQFADGTLRTERSATGDWELVGEGGRRPLEPGYANAVAELAHWSASEIELESARDLQLEIRGLEPPQLRIVVEGAADEEGLPVRLAEVVVGRADGDGLPVQVPDRQPVYRVDDEGAAFVPADAAAFRTRFLSDEDEGPGDVEPASEDAPGAAGMEPLEDLP